MIQRLQARLTGNGVVSRERERESFVRVLTIHFHFALLHSTWFLRRATFLREMGTDLKNAGCETAVGNAPSVLLLSGHPSLISCSSSPIPTPSFEFCPWISFFHSRLPRDWSKGNLAIFFSSLAFSSIYEFKLGIKIMKIWITSKSRRVIIIENYVCTYYTDGRIELVWG